VSPLKVLIAGAGLSGLCLAHALAGKGIAVAVFERDAAPDTRGQGYRLTFDESGSTALRACLPPANYEFIRATAGVAGKVGAFVFMDERAREIHRFSFDLEAAEDSGRITGQVDRRTLRQALLSGMQDRVRFGMALSRYEESARGVVSHFDDGSSADADVLVGADGAKSSVRRQLLAGAEPRDTGIRAIFGRTPLAGLRLSTLGAPLANSGMMALGPRGRIFFCTAMRFRESPAVAAARLGIQGTNWPGDDYVMWAVAVRGELADASLQDAAHRAVDGFHDDYQTLVDRADPNDTLLVPIRVAPRMPPLPPRRVTLIGDAMHVMPPFGAQGANTALKDAQTLASCLLGGGVQRDSAGKAIAEYESEMRRYTRPVMRSALGMMRFATADFPFKRGIFRTFLRIGSLISR
jgi:2-polyprenyl-6-methoxyphenol hydroxylase-like FAD-dependent oxidoreductase